MTVGKVTYLFQSLDVIIEELILFESRLLIRFQVVLDIILDLFNLAQKLSKLWTKGMNKINKN